MKQKKIVSIVITVIIINSSFAGDSSEMDNAKRVFESGRFDNAAELYMKVAETVGNDTTLKIKALMLAGECQIQNNPVIAKKYYSLVLEDKDATIEQQIDAQLQIAHCILLDGDFMNAATSAEKIIALSGATRKQMSDAFFIIGESYIRLKQYDSALVALKKTLSYKEIHPRQLKNIYVMISQIYLLQNNFDTKVAQDKIQILEDELGLKFNMPWYGIIVFLTKSGRFEQSNEICSRLLMENKISEEERENAILFQARNLCGLKKYKEAEEKYKDMLDKNYKYLEDEKPSIYFDLAICLSRQQKYSDAIKVFNRLELNKINYAPIAQLMIGYCCLELKDYNNALEAYNKVLSMPSLKSQYKLLEEANRQIKNIKKIQEDNSLK